MQTPLVLTLPGWLNSDAGHWQTRWEALYGDTRVEQHDWQRPLRGDWIARFEEVVLSLPTATLQANASHGDSVGTARPCIVVAHSLGCHLLAAWAAHSRHTASVQGALLVAPPDMRCEPLRTTLPSWATPVTQRLPFSSIVLASSDDPYGSLAQAQQLASAWGSECIDYGAYGHINADSGLGDWPEGRVYVQQLAASAHQRYHQQQNN